MNRAQPTSLTKLTQKDVSAAAARHEMLYSGRLGGARASFTFCDLSGLNLAGLSPSARIPDCFSEHGVKLALGEFLRLARDGFP